MKKLFVGVLWVALSLSVQGKEVNMTSPDGKYQFTLSDSGGQLHYSLTWNGKQTVKPSLLGINANVEWRDGVEIGTVDSSRKDTIWPMVKEVKLKTAIMHGKYLSIVRMDVIS